MKKFKKVHCKNFSFSYEKVLGCVVLNLTSDLLNRFKNVGVDQYCFSLSIESVLTVYIRTKKKIEFKLSQPENLCFNQLKLLPQNLKSVLDKKKTIYDLYLNDVNKGKYFSSTFLKIALNEQKNLNKIQKFKRISTRNFSFCYNNILTSNILELAEELLQNFKKYSVNESCFSLCAKNTFTVYIKTEKKVEFKSLTPKPLISKKFGYTPENLESVLDPIKLVSDLYLNDVNCGEFFYIHKYMKREIGFIEKTKPIPFKTILGHDFTVCYKNVLDENIDIYLTLLKRFNKLTSELTIENVCGFCCSLDDKAVLTVYFRTIKKIHFETLEPSILVIEKLNLRPLDIKLVIDSYGTIQKLYKQDVFKGHFFCSSFLNEIGLVRKEFNATRKFSDFKIWGTETNENLELYKTYEKDEISEDDNEQIVYIEEEDDENFEHCEDNIFIIKDDKNY